MTDEPLADHRRFNHTLRYQRQLLAELPEGAKTAIDVGCGEGIASRELAEAGLTVTGIDVDAPSIERALAQDTTDITYVVDDLLTTGVEPADVVYAGNMLHFMDITEGLTRLKSLVKPGGRLYVVGSARATFTDLHREIAGSVVEKAFVLVKGSWDPQTPTTWPPPHTFTQVGRAAAEVLPNAIFKKRILWRYTIEWNRPFTDPDATV